MAPENCAIEHHPMHPEHGSGSHRQGSSNLKKAILMALALVVLQAIGSLLSGSLALLADTAHVLSDSIALMIALLAATLSRRPASAHRTYGYYRIEVLAALINGLGVLALAAFIFKEAYDRVLNPQPLEPGLMMIFAMIGLVANIIMLFILRPSHRFNLNMKGAYLHILGDTLSSVIVVASGILMMTTQALWIDAVASCIVAVIIAWLAIQLAWDSIQILLESRPKHLRDRDIEKDLIKRFPQIKNIHDFHVWEITNELSSLSAHIEADIKSLDDNQKLLRELNSYVTEEFGIAHTTFQIEKSVNPSS
jgi:cobalt-zinc-cadmium efflux system protein